MTHVTRITKAGATHPIEPHSVVLLDPATGTPYAATGGAGLTDAQLRAAAVPVAPNITRGGGPVDAQTQRVTLATDGPGVAALASLDAKTPTPVSGAVPTSVQLLGGTIPAHNNVLMSYTGTNLTTVQYRQNSTVVATVTMTYDALGNLLSATRS